MELTSLIRKGSRQFADAPAVRCEGVTQTYRKLHERSCRLANALTNLGIAPGDRVMMLSDNCGETIEQFGGIAFGGFVRSALYTHNSAESNVYLLNLVEAAVLIVERKHYDVIEPLLDEATSLRHVIVFDGEMPDGTLDYEELLSAASTVDPQRELTPEEPYLIRFSAGTTGKPKGILHTVAGWTAVCTEMALSMPRLDQDDRYLAAGPISHAAMLPIAGILAAGGAIVVMPAFHPARFLELVGEEKCTISLLVPTMIQMIVRLPGAEASDLSSLRAVFYGAAPISDQTLAEATALWGQIMYQMYGQSEAVPLTVLGPRDHVVDGNDAERERLRSAGRPTPGTEIFILDPDGKEMPPGEVGEIAARSSTAMECIWHDPAATAERVQPNGSILTRDMGYLDDDGYLFLADRKEDLIISGGFNIWPAELENALASHPAVAEVSVVGIPSEKWGETPRAVIVLREGQEADEEELIDWTRERLGAVKRVTGVDFVDELPKTPIGKVLRRVVRDRYWEGADRVAGA